MAAAAQPLAVEMPALRVGRPVLTLPDIARFEAAAAPGRIDRVGMEGIELPVFVRDASGARVRVPAVADAFVSLDDPGAKGIHMSRLFLGLQEILGEHDLAPATLARLLESFVASHQEMSESSAVAIRFGHLREASALASEHTGWKSYPVTVRARLSDRALRIELGVAVPYSSTCPCSAALSRQVARDRFLERFPAGAPLDRGAVAAWLASPEGMPATPHSQRSHAHVQTAISPDLDELPVDALIDAIETSVGTPVQSAVKREDEQAFAELNGRNLMFCEDASRRIRRGLETLSWLHDYRIRVQHEESLHPHDAVAVLCKGVAGGFTA
jgi:GTP cyclohydrolase I